MSVVDQLEHPPSSWDNEERRILLDTLPMARLSLTAADKGYRNRSPEQRERAWAMAHEHIDHPSPALSRQARSIRRKAARTPMAWGTLRLGGPHRAVPEGEDPALRLSAGLGLHLLPAPWLQLEARLSQEVPLSGEIWTGRVEGLVSVDPLARPTYATWRRLALRPVGGLGLVWGSLDQEGERGRCMRAGLQAEVLKRRWRQDAGVRVTGLELAWRHTSLAGQEWSGVSAELYLGWGTAL